MLKSFMYGVVGAVVTSVLLFLSYTAYQDHQIVRALYQIEVSRQQAAKPATP